MAITHVRTGTGTGFSTTPSAVMGAAPAQNNLLVAFFPGGTSAQTAINSYNQRTVVNDTTTRKAALYDKIAGAAESTTQAPATIAAGAAWTCTVTEYAGNATSSYVDVENAVQDNDATKTSPTVDPTDSIDVVVVGACFWNAGTGTVSGQTVNASTTGVVERSDFNTSRASATWDWIGTTTSGGYNTEGTATAAVTGGCHIAIYKAAVAAGAAVPHRLGLLGVGS